MAACADGATRVAVLTSSRDNAATSIAALAETELSGDANFTVLERQRIDQVLTEQALSLSGLVETDQAVKVGKILGCELLAILEPESGTSPLGLVIFEPTTGLRLADQAISANAADKAAGLVIAALRTADRKRSGAANAKTICIVAARNADLPRDMDSFCDAIGRLLERNLVSSSSFALLERQRLEQVTRERALATDPASRQLVASLVLLDLQVERDPKGVRATALLSDVGGKSLGKVTGQGQVSDAPNLAEALADELARLLKTPAAPHLDLRAEAERFYAESISRTENHDFLRALPPVEAAYALAPDDLVFHAALAEALISDGQTLYRGPDFSAHPSTQPWDRHDLAPPSLLRGARILAALRSQVERLAGKSGDRARRHSAGALTELRNFIAYATWYQTNQTVRTPLPSRDLAIAKRALRQYVLDQDADLLAAVKDEQSFESYSGHVVELLDDNEWLYSVSPQQWLDDFCNTSGQWLALHAKYSRVDAPEGRDALDAIAIGWQFAERRGSNMYGGSGRTRRWDPDAQGLQRFVEVRRALGKDPAVQVRWYGDLMELSIEVTPLFGSTDAIRQRVGAFIAKTKPLLDGPEAQADPELRATLYRLMVRADTLLDSTDAKGAYTPQLLDLALSRHEIFPQTVGRTIRLLGNPDTDDPSRREKRLAIYHRVLTTLDTPDCRAFTPGGVASARSGYRAELEWLQNPRRLFAVQPTTRPWYHSRLLFDVSTATTGIRAIDKPMIDGDYVDVAGFQPISDQVRAARVQLLRVPLKGGEPSRLGMLPTQDLLQWQPSRGGVPRLLDTPAQSACLAEGRYCVSTARDGIMVFPTNGRFPLRLDNRAALPDLHGGPVALLNGRLFAVLGGWQGETYLIAYDLAAKQFDVIASSARKDKRSPFDDHSDLRFVGLAADPQRGRLLVGANSRGDGPSVSGLWSYNPDTQQWRQLEASPVIHLQNNAWSGGMNGMGRSWNGLLPFRAGGTPFLYGLAEGRSLALDLQDDPHLPLGAKAPRYPTLTPEGIDALRRTWLWEEGGKFFIVGSWVWGRWGRSNLVTGQIQTFAPLRPGGPVTEVTGVQPIGDGSSVLVNDYMGLWVVEPFE